MKHTNIQIILFIIMFIQGCAHFTSPKEHPVLMTSLSTGGDWETHVFSLTPERRNVFIIQSDQNLFFCAESPPDVAEEIVSGLRARAEADLNRSEMARPTLEASKDFTSSAQTLFVRSQGIQFLRDSLFGLCQAYLNVAIDKKQFAEKQSELIEKSYTLILKELSTKQQKEKSDAQKLNLEIKETKGSLEASIIRAEKALEEIKQLSRQEVTP